MAVQETLSTQHRTMSTKLTVAKQVMAELV